MDFAANSMTFTEFCLLLLYFPYICALPAFLYIRQIYCKFCLPFQLSFFCFLSSKREGKNNRRGSLVPFFLSFSLLFSLVLLLSWFSFLLSSKGIEEQLQRLEAPLRPFLLSSLFFLLPRFFLQKGGGAVAKAHT